MFHESSSVCVRVVPFQLLKSSNLWIVALANNDQGPDEAWHGPAGQLGGFPLSGRGTSLRREHKSLYFSDGQSGIRIFGTSVSAIRDCVTTM